jgi:NADH-quinone oxidoreductase subunit G
MPTIKINGTSYEVESGLTLIQACDLLGIEIPRFCYHEKLAIAGNCRMCLVELKGANKPVPSCSQELVDGMEFITKGDNIDNIRKGILEFILINHPLDCPICDQGGECDLQDQTIKYGLDKSRYIYEKRAVKDKDLGPLVKTVMTRCIACTRCIRFTDEVCGTYELGGLNRGENIEISNYISKTLTSELSGNLVDICPVGALTNKQYAFKGRPWELKHTDTIDVLDATGSNIRVDTLGLSVARILPRINEEINEEWLGDKSRYICDSLHIQRLDTPLIKVGNKFKEASWDEAFNLIFQEISKLESQQISAIAGDFADVESMFLLKEMLLSLGSTQVEANQDNTIFDVTNRTSYLFNTTIKNIEKADSILLIGVNPKIESPIINHKIRKRYLQGGCKIGVIGNSISLNYKYTHIGENINAIQDLIQDKNPFSQLLSKSNYPLVILGRSVFHKDIYSHTSYLINQLINKFKVIKEGYNGYNVLHTKAANVGALDIGFTQSNIFKTMEDILKDAKVNNIKFIWSLGADEVDYSNLKNTFIVYQGSHGDVGAKFASVILPSSLWLEKDSTYINTEGRIQSTNKSLPLLGLAKEDWKIIRAFSNYLKTPLPYNTLSQIRDSLVKRFSFFNSYNTTPEQNFNTEIFNSNFIKEGEIKNVFFNNNLDNYYVSDSLSRHSVALNQCNKLINKHHQESTKKESL